ncbi:MAG TPA: tetratricopeptide repeat protein [Terracidiphilus sp.]|nr:tetratricopeptide repeat protein [Terracidiphilus sp.]
MQMKIGFMAALALMASLGCASLLGQAGGQNGGGDNPSSSQSKAQQNAPSAPTANVPQSQQKGNPFPGNTNNVPILPSGPTADVPEGNYEPETGHVAFPDRDHDPVRSPESAAEPDNEKGFSSSLSGVDDILPPDEPAAKGKKGDQENAPMPQESPEKDVNVGNYYLSMKNWRAALSRFQSALVLDPENPDVYWGLAESERHTGDFVLAREHYMKVIEYDPGSKHAKEAKKALKDPEIANAKPAPGGTANATQP